MDRVFLDSNVLFSACYGSARILRLWEAAAAGRCRLLTSGYVLQEVLNNLSTPAQREILASCLDGMEIVPEPPADLPCALTLPRSDRPVFLAAVAAGATHLLTGDRRAFGEHYRKRVAGTLILPPAEYP